MTKNPFIAVCSNRPRPRLQSKSHYFMKTGAAAWGRDPYHILGYNYKTLCGRSTRDWLTIGEMEKQTPDLCERCASKLAKEPTHD